MAPSFDHLPDPEDEEFDDEEEELYFSDLQEKYQVQLQQGLDTFVVIDGLPKDTEETKQKLVKFLLRKLNSVGKTREDLIFMPIGESGQTDGYAIDVKSMILLQYSYLTDLLLSSIHLLLRPRLQSKV